MSDVYRRAVGIRDALGPRDELRACEDLAPRVRLLGAVSALRWFRYRLREHPEVRRRFFAALGEAVACPAVKALGHASASSGDADPLSGLDNREQVRLAIELQRVAEALRLVALAHSGLEKGP